MSQFADASRVPQVDWIWGKNFFMFERTKILDPNFWIGTSIPPTHPRNGWWWGGGVGQVPLAFLYKPQWGLWVRPEMRDVGSGKCPLLYILRNEAPASPCA